MNMKVQVLSSKVIKPSIPTPPSLKNYKISFLDQLATPVHFGIIFFFFSNGKEDETANEIARRCDHLEESLSETLTRFYPLAGRFLRDKSLVECNDQGVEVSRANVLDACLPEIVYGRPETKLLDTFVPNETRMGRSVQWPVLAIQINIFGCGGLAVGIRYLHSVGDGISLVNFLTDWAATNCKGPNQKMISGPSFEVASLFPGRELMGLKPVPTANILPARKLVTKSFVFDGAIISSLKAEVDIEAPSRVLVVTAHIWRTLIGIARVKHGRPRPSLVSFAMNLRGRIPLQIPKNGFGNLVGHTTVQFYASESKVDLGDLVNRLKTAIRKTSKDYAKARHGDDLYSMLISYYNEIGGDKPPEVDLCRFTSWCGFSCYEIDFGWGKPCWIATVSKNIELFFLLDTKCGDAIEAWVTLNAEDMIEFERQYANQCKPSTVRVCSKL
ncbi:hypothetical protein Acr_12g0001410 [Actinidia rufa]|uniref:HXXXD-type acyl-transferase family protein n=1 Tax=Actinidia rufa TaxID=165716 RepID=A0A7J0FFX6_9ERIC|nr:hypothetical protein Acr_12g0001410 [Actinidia rufa]